MTTQILVQGGDARRWEQAIYAFLAEKERRSGSMRTVRAYSGMLYRFFGTLGKPPVSSPKAPAQRAAAVAMPDPVLEPPAS